MGFMYIAVTFSGCDACLAGMIARDTRRRTKRNHIED